MKRLLVFVLAIVLFGSCSSKKILSVRKIAHNGVINNIASQYDLSQKQFSTLNNSKKNSAKNLSDVEASITPVSNNQDFLASKNKIEPIEKLYFPNSIGLLYEAFTQFIGFKKYGEEYKMMGLSSLGKPKYKNLIKKNLFEDFEKFRLNLDYFNHQ